VWLQRNEDLLTGPGPVCCSLASVPSFATEEREPVGKVLGQLVVLLASVQLQ
jgi:hypothetical protein